MDPSGASKTKVAASKQGGGGAQHARELLASMLGRGWLEQLGNLVAQHPGGAFFPTPSLFLFFISLGKWVATLNPTPAYMLMDWLVGTGKFGRKHFGHTLNQV